MTKYRIFFIFSLSFIGGIAIASFYYPQILSASLFYFSFVFTLSIVAVFWENKKVVLFGFALGFFVCGFWLANLRLEKIKNLNADKQNFSGIVMISKEPVMKEKIQQLILVSADNKREKFLLNASIYEKYNYGDRLKINCVLERPKNFDENFDYQMYLAKDGIFYECKNPKIEKLEKNNGNRFLAVLISIKNNFNEKINQLIPAPESGLLSGLLLGGSNQLSKEVKDNFSRTGMTHVVAVSGYNVTIIAEYLMLLGIFLGLWRRQAFWFAVTGIILFVILTGLSASAVRAGLMGVLLIWAMKNGRLGNTQNAILFSACVMLLANPLLLRWDIGFQLSFLATIGIVYLYPFFENYFLHLVETRHCLVSSVAEILFLSLSAQIFVLPIIMFNFGTLSLISLLANILILPIIPLTMLLGFVAIMFSFVFEPIAIIFSWLTYLPLKYETVTINYLASLKYASIEMKIAWWGVVIWYIILVGIVVILKKKIKN
ncbi:MAG: internalization-related competence protein ComEC/Rec2 protein [Candidatus Moranbacteria bacterium GW2011_GWF2_36_839]|nr:MAG: internalization-related competence protein ComEC/Rec2 protein [Candidatus Moranbacteria bacterium GW2011_GWF1_36_78]KKQ17321.1 MAG: internalization-related competence protein ComEC/Rec2 protein [Candidatus Moranbacteria bacterium GW2011_GWF2_36_839]HAT73834.1 hypothetical protein [Candidatus Moranbacteria bacterium]HBY11023.1 hypothetical protein [Candidatus Moranbacteria bacterium]